MNDQQTQLLIMLRREVAALRKVVAVLRREVIKANTRIARIELSESFTDSSYSADSDDFPSEPDAPEV